MKFNKRKSKKELQYPQILQLDDDFALIQRFIEGDESTFRILVQRHKDKIRNIIYLVLNSSDMVDDIAQEVLITTYRNLKSFRFESQFSTWLYRITVNKCKDHLRKIKIRSIFAPIKDGDEDPKYIPSTEGKDISEFVHKAISRLPEKLRVPLMLKDIEGFSYQEIAESMDCEIGTVKSRIFRARESLREYLEPFKKELME